MLVHHPVDTKRQPHYKLIQCKLQARVKTYLLTLIVVNLHFCCFHHNFPKNKKKCKKQYHYTAAKTCEPLQRLHTLMSPSPVTVIEKLVKANSWINFFPGLLFSWGNVFLVSCVKHIQHSCAFWHRENDDDDDKLMCQKYRDGWNNSLVNFSDLNNNCSDDMHTNNKLELGWVAQGMQI